MRAHVCAGGYWQEQVRLHARELVGGSKTSRGDVRRQRDGLHEELRIRTAGTTVSCLVQGLPVH